MVWSVEAEGADVVVIVVIIVVIPLYVEQRMDAARKQSEQWESMKVGGTKKRYGIVFRYRTAPPPRRTLRRMYGTGSVKFAL